MGWYTKSAKKKTTKNTIPGKLTFRNKGDTKTFPDKQKLREFITTRIDLQEMLKVALQVEIKGCYVTIWEHKSIKLTGTGKNMVEFRLH